ncbi:MAG: isoprenylcysteine carboxylmethyltransferase family protein [Candidatus Omnitrophica bacterium]|nr:isoprenylcysteine carboxylmethyltransferase family protein [Candidatus Omnitrophota bacterium]
MKKRIGIQGFLMFTALITTVIFFKYLVPTRNGGILKLFLDVFAVLLMTCGFLLRISARGYKAQHSANSRTLVTGGPYALMRNPMYAGTFLIGTGLSLFIFSWWVCPVFIFIFLLIYIPQIKKEEAVLYRRFTEEYGRYRRQTPRFFPGPAKLFNKGIRKHIVLKWEWANNEFPSLAGVVALVIAIDVWKDIKFLGHIDYLRGFIKSLLVILCFCIIALLFYEKKDTSEKF